MRQRGSIFTEKSAYSLVRIASAALLIACLILSLAPIATPPVAAAPPDSSQEAPDASEAVTDPDAGRERRDSDPQLASVPLPDSNDASREDRVLRDLKDAGVDSVRPRGVEAPVDLRRQEAQGGEAAAKRPDKNRDEASDPGDGPVAKPDRQPRERVHDRADLPNRVWPMPEESYTFTQQFGCVQQLGNLYFPGAGCPASAPVIHTGIDLAAPEGTPFYAAASGWVTLADYDRPTSDANTRIIIQHDGRNDGFATDYLHWIASYVEEGEYVRVGEPIGEVGSVGYSTGPHLHFSVTDLESGEHVDPMRWLPEESGPSDYPRSTTPRAQLRLPAGTTAGQPESADPSPPPPPVRQDVPESPPDDEVGRDRAERRSDRDREEHRTDKDEEAEAPSSNRNDRERSATNEPTEESDADETVDEPTEKQRERRQERNRDGTDAESSDSSDDRTKRKDAEEDEFPDEEPRRNREARDDSGGGGGDKSNREDERDARGDGKRNDSGGRDGNDGKNGSGGRDGEDGAKGEDGENGGDGEHGGNGGGGGGGGGDGDNGGDGGDGGSGGDDESGGDGGDGGDRGDGDAGAGGDGGDGGNGGNGDDAGSGGDGGDGGESLSNPDGDETRGGAGGSGGSGAETAS